MLIYLWHEVYIILWIDIVWLTLEVLQGDVIFSKQICRRKFS